MPIAIILVAVVILGGVVVVAMGRGGELSRDTGADQPDVDFDSWADVAGYRPPPALLGYEVGATEQALMLISRAMADRDAEIAWLRGRLRELQPEGERGDGTLTGAASAGGREPSGMSPDPALDTGPVAERTPTGRIGDDG